ncbi:MAG: hypothetical protein ACTHQQ_00615 [Solirubrobacteraceae bacterium]
MATQRTAGESPGSAQRTTRQSLIDFTQLGTGEVIAVTGGALLATSVFLAWFTLGRSLEGGVRRKPAGVL